ncbi:GMC family oxidoreductase [Caulobacter sp. Root487D2Y]|uniref:GMC oxidoreductase n=1 Tax=Caulobacter sp. Root487D2Y TaxID=1736547 RepID=UPI000700DD20|nr:GMC family oxidoreductase [Caulobacter sp. Root487D2Y]KQY29916.1 GMC family oxidoreductase [Caulobacter sp. Root487D2Y]
MAFIDARTLPDASRIEADLVIIGGGLAGITLARELAGGPLKVAILESGGREIDEEIQGLYAGTAVVKAPDNPDKPFDDYPVQSRARVLGGSGMIWGGKCVPLDPADFTARAWAPHSGWPVTRPQLQPFYDRACDLLEIPRFDADNKILKDPARPPLALDPQDGFFSAPRVFTRYSGGADKAAFDRFRTDFADAPNITVYLHVNVTQVRLGKDGDKVEALDVACLNGKRHTAVGRTYVLAVGGIENVRLLLASNGVRPEGIGNRHDLVGRFFQGHVTYSLDGDAETEGTAVHVSRQPSMSLYLNPGRTGAHCVVAAGLPAQARMGTGNFTATLYAVTATGAGTPTEAETRAVRQVAARVDGNRQVGDGGDGQLLGFFAMSEHFPNPDSRVTLDPSAKDPLGMPRIHLEWRYAKADWDSLERSAAGFGDALGASGQGRVCWPVQRGKLLEISSASRHHMGTTRMSADPTTGVVDPNLKVHETANLYVAGSSVFPTSGIANPTLTILALVMRLADHLKRDMGVRS